MDDAYIMCAWFVIWVLLIFITWENMKDDNHWGNE